MSNKEEKLISELAEKHGNFYELPVGDKSCYLKVPSMQDFKRGFAALSKDGEIGYTEEMLSILWLGGDDCIKTDEDYFLSAKDDLKDLLEFDEALVNHLEKGRIEIDIQGYKCQIRKITREDLRKAERANPANKTFVTQEKLFEMIVLEKDDIYDDKNNAEIRFPLYKALKEVQNTKYSRLKKHSRKLS